LKEYFQRQLYEEYPREALESILWSKGLIGIVNKEVVRAMKKKKRQDQMECLQKCETF